MAIAPPFGFTCWRIIGNASARSVASPGWQTPRSVLSHPSARWSGPRGPAPFALAGTGPMPMTRGATPAADMPTTRAIGVRPCADALASDAISSAAAPSFTPEALPAVTVLSAPLMPRSLPRLSPSVPGAGVRPWPRQSDRPCAGESTGVISSANTPAACAASNGLASATQRRLDPRG